MSASSRSRLDILRRLLRVRTNIVRTLHRCAGRLANRPAGRPCSDVRGRPALLPGHRARGRHGHRPPRPDHPGVDDPAYLARRGEIAAAALRWEPGTPAPAIDYTEPSTRSGAPSAASCGQARRLAHSAYREAWDAVGLPTDRVPQLEEVTAASSRSPASASSPPPASSRCEQFYGSLADRVFHSTQYLRHPAEPLYTPEPDLVHEIIGHGVMLGSPALLRAAPPDRRGRPPTGDRGGADVPRAGVLVHLRVRRRRGGRRAAPYGAGLLSSYGEIEEFRSADVRPLDFLEMGTAEYDITHYQPILYRAESLDHLMDAVGGFFASIDDDTPARLGPRSARPRADRAGPRGEAPRFSLL